MTASDAYFIPQWPLPAGVKALVTTRSGGVSGKPFYSNNLALHVGDNPDHVAANRSQLAQQLPTQPIWLGQTHSTRVVELSASQRYVEPLDADAAFSRQPQMVCAVMTADCLPLLLASDDGVEVAAVHAGWRGLAQGIVSKTLAKFSANASSVSAYLGPAISQQYFEVGIDVYNAFVQTGRAKGYAVDSAFLLNGKSFCATDLQPNTNAKLFADLYALARLELNSLGVERVFGGGECTYGDKARYFSYRRDGQTGRMASLIWRQ